MIYPITNKHSYLLVAERALVKNAWKKKAMAICENPQPKYIKN